MPTLLVNPKMSPALAARIEASVAGRRGQPGRRFAAPRLMSIVRLGLVAAVALVVIGVVVVRRSEQQALERDRATLLASVQKESATLTDADRGAVAKIEAWLPRMGGVYEGDLIPAEARA